MDIIYKYTVYLRKVIIFALKFGKVIIFALKFGKVILHFIQQVIKNSI